MMRKFFLFLFFTIVLIGCRKDSHVLEDHSGGFAVIALQGTPENLFPFDIREYNAQEISRFLINPSLTVTGEGGTAEPQLALSWQNSEKNKDITYFLNPESKWSDGNKVTSIDVYKSYEFLLRNKENAGTLYKPDIIAKVETPDSFTVRFIFNRPVAEPELLTRFPVLKADQIKGKTWDELKKFFYTHFIGCGPYVLAKTTSRSVHLRRNPVLDKTAVNLDSLVFRFYTSGDTLKAWIKNNNVDLIPDAPQDLLIDMDMDTSYTVMSSGERGYTFLGWNLENRVLTPEVRLALTLALDRRTIVEALLAGYGQVEDSPAYPEFWAYYKTEPRPYDPEEARELLKNAGWTLNRSNQLFTKNGKTLEITLLTNKENLLRTQLSTNIISYWQAIGIDAKMEILPWDLFLQRLHDHDFDVALVGWAETDQFDPSELYHSAGIANDNNFMNYKSDSVDTFIEKALTEPEMEKRRQNWIKFQRTVIEDLPVSVLFSKRLVNIISTRLKNVRINDRGYLNNAKEWWQDERK